MPTTQIKDPVHGYVELPDALVDGVVDTRPFQRLRYVRQLSATHLVYPGANHTRFEHSLGVYHLGRTVFENLRQQSYFAREATVDELEEIQRTLECACLLHDVGHPPFSHLSEGFLDEGVLRERVAETGLVDAFDAAGVGGAPLRSANPHELLGCVIIVEEYGDALRAFEDELSCVDRQRRRLLEHLGGVSGPGLDAAIDVWERLDDLEGECDEIAADRQKTLADPPMTADSVADADGDRTFYEYLYEPTSGPRYPVLAAVSELADRIRTDRDRVASRLAGGR
jgi:HD superfamily phosphohydrolase